MTSNTGQTKRARLLAGVALLLLAPSLFAQELVPRAYWPAPIGTKIVLVGYAYSSGDVVVDPSLPLVGVDSEIHQGVFAYRHTFSLAGRTATVQAELPYADSETTGTYLDEPASRITSGFGDLATTLSINLFGAPAMTVVEFQELRANPRPILGASIKVVAPTGKYDADKVINIGTNRWAVKAKLGYIRPMGRKWMLELAAGTWFFQDDDEFILGKREQDPITAVEANLIHRFGNGIWGSVDLNYYFGGRTTIDGSAVANFQRNSRVGVTFAYPIARRHLIKASYSAGVTTSFGGDYGNFNISYAFVLP